MTEPQRTVGHSYSRFGMVSEQGGRPYNEDACAVHDYSARRHSSYLCFLAVADGMGGHQAGDVASQVALQTLEKAALPRAFASPAAFEKQAESVLWDGFSRANSHICDLGEATPEHKGMGTTLTCALVGHRYTHLGHVGDSRAYLISSKGISQLTEDHSVVGKMVTEGVLTEREAQTHAKRNILTRAVGPELNVEIDIVKVAMSEGDTLFLCTDGLCSVVSGGEIFQVLTTETDVHNACQNLVDLALARGSGDNITAVSWRMPVGARERESATSGGYRAGLRWWTAALIALIVLGVSLGIGWGLGSLLFKKQKVAAPSVAVATSPSNRSSSASASSTVNARPADSATYAKGTRLVLTLSDSPSIPLRSDHNSASSADVNVPAGCQLEVLDGPYSDDTGGQWYHVVVRGPTGISEVGQQGFLMAGYLKTP